MATVTYTRVTVKADFQAQTYLGRTAQVSDVVALDNGGFAFAYSVIDSSTGDRSPMVEFYDAKYGSGGNPFFVSSASTVSLTGQISIAKLDSGNVAVGYTGAGQMQAAIYTDTGAVVDSHVPFTAYG